MMYEVLYRIVYKSPQDGEVYDSEYIKIEGCPYSYIEGSDKVSKFLAGEVHKLEKKDWIVLEVGSVLRRVNS